VQQGDHLDKLAYRFGTDPDTLWQNGKNAELVARRKNRSTLYPGDVLYVPAEPTPPLPLEAGSTNKYTARVPKIAVTLKIDSKQRPVAGKPFEVHGLGGAEPVRGTCGASGEVSFQAPVIVREVQVCIPEVGMVIPVHIGGLDPLEERSGAVQRLRNLGYLPARANPSEALVAQAIRAFQRSCQLEETGALDAATLQALERAHQG
jgi:hypothetical protein